MLWKVVLLCLSGMRFASGASLLTTPDGERVPGFAKCVHFSRFWGDTEVGREFSGLILVLPELDSEEDELRKILCHHEELNLEEFILVADHGRLKPNAEFSCDNHHNHDHDHDHNHPRALRGDHDHDEHDHDHTISFFDPNRKDTFLHALLAVKARAIVWGLEFDGKLDRFGPGYFWSEDFDMHRTRYLGESGWAKSAVLECQVPETWQETLLQAAASRQNLIDLLGNSSSIPLTAKKFAPQSVLVAEMSQFRAMKESILGAIFLRWGPAVGFVCVFLFAVLTLWRLERWRGDILPPIVLLMSLTTSAGLAVFFMIEGYFFTGNIRATVREAFTFLFLGSLLAQGLLVGLRYYSFRGSLFIQGGAMDVNVCGLGGRFTAVLAAALWAFDLFIFFRGLAGMHIHDIELMVSIIYGSIGCFISFVFMLQMSLFFCTLKKGVHVIQSALASESSESTDLYDALLRRMAFRITCLGVAILITVASVFLTNLAGYQQSATTFGAVSILRTYSLLWASTIVILLVGGKKRQRTKKRRIRAQQLTAEQKGTTAEGPSKQSTLQVETHLTDQS